MHPHDRNNVLGRLYGAKPPGTLDRIFDRVNNSPAVKLFKKNAWLINIGLAALFICLPLASAAIAAPLVAAATSAGMPHIIAMALSGLATGITNFHPGWQLPLGLGILSASDRLMDWSGKNIKSRKWRLVAKSLCSLGTAIGAGLLTWGSYAPISFKGVMNALGTVGSLFWTVVNGGTAALKASEAWHYYQAAENSPIPA